MKRLLVVVVLTFVLSISACAGTQVETPQPKPAAASAPAQATVVPTTAPAAVAQETLGTIEIHSFEMGFKPQMLEVEKPGRYTVTLINDGVVMHDIAFVDGTKLVANAGETVSGEVDIPAEGLSFICSVPGHEAAGMKGAITITGATVEAAPAADDHSGPAPTTDVTADPNAPAYTLFDAAAAPASEATVHDIDLVVEEKAMTVAEGFVQHVWTFGGTVPGPVIRVRVGDTIRIHLKNPTTSKVPHSIDFHSSEVA